MAVVHREIDHCVDGQNGVGNGESLAGEDRSEIHVEIGHARGKSGGVQLGGSARMLCEQIPHRGGVFIQEVPPRQVPVRPCVLMEHALPGHSQELSARRRMPVDRHRRDSQPLSHLRDGDPSEAVGEDGVHDLVPGDFRRAATAGTSCSGPVGGFGFGHGVRWRSLLLRCGCIAPAGRAFSGGALYSCSSVARFSVHGTSLATESVTLGNPSSANLRGRVLTYLCYMHNIK